MCRTIISFKTHYSIIMILDTCYFDVKLSNRTSVVSQLEWEIGRLIGHLGRQQPSYTTRGNGESNLRQGHLNDSTS